MQDYKHRMRSQLTKIYKQELLNNIFKHPYTKIEFVMEDLDVKRKAATKYLDLLVEKNFLKLIKIGRSNFYINDPLFKLFSKGSVSKIDNVPIKTFNPVSINGKL